MNSTVLALHSGDKEIMELGRNTPLDLSKPMDVYIVPKQRGVEDYITVLAES
jgi:hypothetical protein